MKLALSQLSRSPAPVRLGAFLVALLLLWAPIALPLYTLVKDSNTVSIVTLLVLYLEFIWLARFWGRRVYRQPNLLWVYGLEFSKRFGLELLAGLSIGLISLLALFLTQGAFGWVIWQLPTIALPTVVLEGLLMALGIGFAEELLFRGWLLDELQRDYRADVVLWADATVFALVHGFRPQFPALLLLGLTLVWAKRSCWDLSVVSRAGNHRLRRERLGLPMGLHAGLVWGYYIVNVGQLVTYSQQVPLWVTGFDRNPLAGAMGLLFLSALVLGMWQFASRSQASGHS